MFQQNRQWLLWGAFTTLWLAHATGLLRAGTVPAMAFCAAPGLLLTATHMLTARGRLKRHPHLQYALLLGFPCTLVVSAWITGALALPSAGLTAPPWTLRLLGVVTVGAYLWAALGALAAPWTPHPDAAGTVPTNVRPMEKEMTAADPGARRRARGRVTLVVLVSAAAVAMALIALDHGPDEKAWGEAVPEARTLLSIVPWLLGVTALAGWVAPGFRRHNRKVSTPRRTTTWLLLAAVGAVAYVLYRFTTLTAPHGRFSL